MSYLDSRTSWKKSENRIKFHRLLCWVVFQGQWTPVSFLLWHASYYWHRLLSSGLSTNSLVPLQTSGVTNFALIVSRGFLKGFAFPVSWLYLIEWFHDGCLKTTTIGFHVSTVSDDILDRFSWSFLFNTDEAMRKGMMQHRYICSGAKFSVLKINFLLSTWVSKRKIAVLESWTIEIALIANAHYRDRRKMHKKASLGFYVSYHKRIKIFRNRMENNLH